MTWRDLKENWRWRHVVPGLLTFLWIPLSLPAAGVLIYAELYVLAPMVMFGPLLLWTCVIDPWLDSSDPRFSETRPPRRRASTLRLRAWAPCLLAALVPVLLLLDAIVNWFLVRQWEPYGWLNAWWLIPIGVLALHAMAFDRVLQSRLREAAVGAGVCYGCAYDLSGLPGGACCPECGRAVESSGAAGGSGGSNRATARS